MEGSTKVKIVSAVAVVLVGAPLYLLSGGSMQARVDEAWEKAGGKPSAPYYDGRVKDPEMAKTLYWLARIYRITYRDDECAALCHDWLRRYGGDDTDWTEGKICPWEPGYWGEDAHKRPDYYNKEPHPLTPKVLLMYGDYWEHKRFYDKSDPCYRLIVDKMASLDPDATKQAQQAVMRAKTRTF